MAQVIKPGFVNGDEVDNKIISTYISVTEGEKGEHKRTMEALGLAKADYENQDRYMEGQEQRGHWSHEQRPGFDEDFGARDFQERTKGQRVFEEFYADDYHKGGAALTTEMKNRGHLEEENVQNFVMTEFFNSKPQNSHSSPPSRMWGKWSKANAGMGTEVAQKAKKEVRERIKHREMRMLFPHLQMLKHGAREWEHRYTIEHPEGSERPMGRTSNGFIPRGYRGQEVCYTWVFGAYWGASKETNNNCDEY